MVFNSNDSDRIDLKLLRHGPITLFWKESLFSEAVSSLAALGYNRIQLNCDSQAQFQKDLSRALKWEAQFGYAPWNGNLNALNDGLIDEPSKSANDTVLSIKAFHLCVARDENWAGIFLDIFAEHSRNYLLYGKRLIVLVQTDDATYKTDKLGGRPANWNEAEWFRSKRG